MVRIKAHKALWAKIPAGERVKHMNISQLIKQNMDLIMKTVMLDRENERIMLKHGMVPPDRLPSSSQNNPGAVAGMYQRNQPGYNQSRCPSKKSFWLRATKTFVVRSLRFVRSKRIDVAEAGTVQDVYGYLGKDEFDLIFIEASYLNVELIDFLGDLNQRSEKPLVVPLVNGDPDSFVLECIKGGAFDFLSKPFSREQIEIALHKAGNYNQISKTNAAIVESSVDDAEREILGESQLIEETRKMIKQSGSDAGHCVDPGRKRNGQGIGCAGIAYPEPPCAEAVHQDKLCCPAGDTD